MPKPSIVNHGQSKVIHSGYLSIGFSNDAYLGAGVITW